MPANVNRQLVDAAEAGDLKKVRALIEKGAEIEAAQRDGETAFLVALHGRHDEVWRYLLEAGARIDAKTEDGITAMHFAGGTDNVEALGVLLDRGLSLEARDRDGQTPLIAAAESLAPAAVEWLLGHGADPNARDKAGGTSLHAVYRGVLMFDADFEEVGAPLVALLEKHGGDPTIKDVYGRKPEDIT